MKIHFLLIIILSVTLSSCRTGSCPNYVFPKPEIYNQAKLKSSVRNPGEKKYHSALGVTIDFYFDDNSKNRITAQKSKIKKQKPILKIN